MIKQAIIVITHTKSPPDYRDLLQRDVEYYPADKGLAAVAARKADLVVLDCGFTADCCIELLK